ncbi:MFS transporter [Actinomycetes bacterium KLBMP 9759]
MTEVRDWNGRTYRVGEQPEELIGRPRSAVLRNAWAAMAAVGVLQYGFGAAVPALTERNGWSLVETFWLLAVWVVFQAGAGFPVAHLRERGRLGSRSVMVTGALLCGTGVLSLAHGTDLTVVMLGYSVLGGTGAGLVYAACTSTVAKWYPDRMAATVGLVTGAFAYGSAPLVIAAVIGLDAATLPIALDVVAALVVLLVLVPGAGLQEPPANWWPTDVDPRAWALARRSNPPAVRDFSAQQALRTRALPVMWAILLCAGAVALFDAAFVVVFAAGTGAGTAAVALAAGVLVGVGGASRARAVGISERRGRCRTIAAVLLVQAVGQALLAAAAASGSAVVLVLGACVAGLGGGGFYPLFASLAREFFGERNALTVHAVVYSAKAGGGLLGIGLAASAVVAWGFTGTFLLAACVSLGSAWATGALHRPGLPSLLPRHRPMPAR